MVFFFTTVFRLLEYLQDKLLNHYPHQLPEYEYSPTNQNQMYNGLETFLTDDIQCSWKRLFTQCSIIVRQG